MTRDDVIRMAAEACGEFRLTGAVMFGADELQLFAEKVADSVIESVAQHLETSSDRHRRDYFAAKVRELKTQAPTVEHSSALPPIERDEDMDRTYIPIPGGWEIQTKGNGSTFRLCNTKTHDRWPVLDDHLHDALEQMARDCHEAAAPAQQAGQDRIDAKRYRWLRSVGVWLDPSKFAKATRVLDAAIDAAMKGESK